MYYLSFPGGPRKEENISDPMVLFSFILFKAVMLRARSHCVIFSDCDCNSSYRNKWVVQDSMEVFTLCDCNIINKNKLQSQSEKTHSVNKP